MVPVGETSLGLCETFPGMSFVGFKVILNVKCLYGVFMLGLSRDFISVVTHPVCGM